MEIKVDQAVLILVLMECRHNDYPEVSFDSEYLS